MNRNRKPPRFPLSDGEPNPLETVALWLLGALIAAWVDTGAECPTEDNNDEVPHQR